MVSIPDCADHWRAWTRGASRVKQVGVIGLLLGIGAWPYVSYLRFWPFTRDAVQWITRGALYQRDWYQWVFAKSHFGVGYRPVAALSYTLNYLVAGLNPMIYRVTDLGLHLLAGLLVFVLFRRLVRDAPAWGAVVAACLFMAHPAVENVVPFTARRSYTLATVLSLSALVVLCRPPGQASRSAGDGRTPLWGRSLIAGLLFLCAFLSNEVAFVTLPIVPLLLIRPAWMHRLRWTRILVLCAGPLVAIIAAIALRSWIIGGIGGYGRPAGRGDGFYSILQLAWRNLGAFSSRTDAGQLEGSWMLTACLAMIGSYYFWQAFFVPIRTKRGARPLLPAILMVWLAGYSLLYALTGVWFPRQVYPMLVPMSLLVGCVLIGVVQAYRDRRWALAAHLVPQVLLVAIVLGDSPLIHGSHPWRRRMFEAQHRRQLAPLEGLGGVSDPAYVRLVLPYGPLGGSPNVMRANPMVLPRRAQVSGLWVETLLHDRDIRIMNFLFLEQDSLSQTDPPTFRWIDDRPTVELGPNQLHYIWSSGRFLRRHVDLESTVRLDEPRLPSNRYCYVWMGAGPDRGLTLLQEPAPPAGRRKSPD